MGRKEKGMEIIMGESVVKHTDAVLEQKIMADRKKAVCAVVCQIHEVLQMLPFYHYVCQDDGTYLTIFSLKKPHKAKCERESTPPF